MINSLNSLCVRSEVRGGVTPDVGHAVDGVPAAVGTAEGELGVALLRCGRVLGQELYDVWVVIVASQAASADDMHDARQHIAGATTETPHPRATSSFLFLTRVQDLQWVTESRIDCGLSDVSGAACKRFP